MDEIKARAVVLTPTQREMLGPLLAGEDQKTAAAAINVSGTRIGQLMAKMRDSTHLSRWEARMDEKRIKLADLTSKEREERIRLLSSEKVPEGFVPRPLVEVSRDHIKATIEYCGGNIREAAKLLKIGRATVYRYLKEWAAHEAKKHEKDSNSGSGVSDSDV